MEYVIIAGQLVLALSILIVLHELGHFIPAKLFGTRVEKFYLFFDPWFSLFKYKKGETEYGIGWLPLGGYVKISGMVDESFDTEMLKEEPKPWEFRSKPAWQRLIIMLGGVTINFILGFLIFSFILFRYGEEYLPNENAEYGIAVDSLGYEMGLRDGDQIVSIGDQDFDRFDVRTVLRQIIFNNASQITIMRDGEKKTLPIDEKFVGLLTSYKNRNRPLFNARFPFKIMEVQKGSPAEEAGFKKDDEVLTLNGEPSRFFHEFSKKAGGLKGEEVSVSVLRNDRDTMNFNLTLTEKGRIGVAAYAASHFFEMERQNFTFAEALPAGFVKGWTFLSDQIKAFGQMFRGKIKASESLGGFGTIAKLFPSTWNWEIFWRNTAILSLILGFMNLLPIPALDGGHVMFLLYEVVTGRKPSDKFVEYATIAGFILVIALVLYANGLDIYRWIFK